MLNFSASGMGAAQAAMGVAAHNTANLAKPGFRSLQLVQAALPAGGVSTVDPAAPSEVPALEADLLGLLQAKHSFLADLAVFKTADEVMGRLLDQQA